ncbi:hypothetical protein [Mycobacteroides abscessus]
MAGVTGWWAEYFASIQGRQQNAAASLTALQHNEARISVELTQAVASVLGVEHPKGSFEADIQYALAALSGSPIQVGDFAAELDIPLAALSGVHFQLGNIVAIEKPVVGLLSALQYQRGNFSAELRKPVASMSGFLLPQGPIAAILQRPRSVLSGQHIQRGALVAPLRKTSAALDGKQRQSGTLAVALKKALTIAAASHSQRGSFAVPGKKPAAVMNGEFIGVTPVAIDQVGTPGSENTGNLTCTINPASGADVVVLAWVSGGSSSCYQGVYGGSSLPMRLLGRVKFNSGQLAAFLIENVASGSATATISKTGSDWAQAVALSYTGAADFRQVKVAKGQGTTCSQSATPGSNARSIQSFTRGGISGAFSGPSGGTNRINETSGFVVGTVSDNNISGTFSASITASANWGGVVVDATPSTISAPKINYTGAVWSEINGGTQTFSVRAAVNDYVVVDIAQAGNGDPSSVTLDGVSMTLIDTQAFTHPNTSAGFLKRYRSAQIGSAGDKTVSITTTGSQWWHAGGWSISNVTSFGTPAKSSGTSSTPTQSVTCAAGQLILQSFVVPSAPTDLTAANFFDSPGASQLYLLMNAAEETTTFTVSNSMNWAAMATVIS